MSYLGQPVYLTVTPEGRVGIGSSQPRVGVALDVNGDIYATGTITGSNLTIFGDTVTLATITSNTERVVISNNTPGPALTVRQAGTGVGYAVMEAYDDETGIAFKIADGGNIGIGTDVPMHKMHVVGTVSATTLLGDAAGVTGLATSAYTNTTNATNITTGTLAKDRVATVLNSTSFVGAVGIGSTEPRTGVDLDVAGGATYTLPVFPPRPLTANTTVIANAPQVRLNGTYTIAGSYPDTAGTNEAWYAVDGASNTAWRTNAYYTPSFDSGGDPNTSQYQMFVNSTISPSYPGEPLYGNHLTLALPSFALIKSYSLTRWDTLNETPGSWHLLGSSNAVEWRYVDTKTNYSWASGSNAVAHVSLANSTYYRYYRMLITANAEGDGSAKVSRIREWQLFGDVQAIAGVKMYEPLSIWQTQGSSTPMFYANTDTARIGVGTSTPQELMHIHDGNLRIGTLAGATTRSISVNALGNVIVTPSDASLKTNVRPLRAGAVELHQLRPVSFEWIDKTNYGTQTEYGLIAQEVATIFPNMVGTAPDGTLNVDYMKLIPVLIKGYQELLAEVEALKSRLR